MKSGPDEYLGIIQDAESNYNCLYHFISEKKNSIRRIFEKIAEMKNELAVNESGIGLKINNKKDKIREKYSDMLEDIQFQINNCLIEKEKLIREIAGIRTKIQETTGNRSSIEIPETIVDLTEESQKEINLKEGEIKVLCQEEFQPYITDVLEKHHKDIERIQFSAEQEIDQIQQTLDRRLQAYIPEVDNESEKELEKNFYSEQEEENRKFSKLKSILIKSMKKIEDESRVSLQEIEDNFEIQLFNYEKVFKDKKKSIWEFQKGSELKPDPLVLTHEQEEEINNWINNQVQKEIEDSIINETNLIHEDFVKTEIYYTDKAKTEIQTKINILEQQNLVLRKEITHFQDVQPFLIEELNSYKVQWEDLNNQKHEKEEQIQIISLDIDRLKEKQQILASKNVNNNQKEAFIEIPVKKELESFIAQSETMIENHKTEILKMKDDHKALKLSIKQRASQLLEKKDTIIADMKQKIINTNHESKNIAKTLSQVISMV